MALIFVKFYIMQFVRVLLVYVIPKSVFFLHRINPRITSRMTTTTDVTEPAMMELSEVSDIGVLARGPVDIAVLVLKDVLISN